MNTQKQTQQKKDETPTPSEGPLKNEPTPEKAAEQKQRQSERAGEDVAVPGQRPPSDS